MKSTDNKKAPESWRSRSFSIVNKGILTMNNITQFTQDKQVLVSEQQLRNLLGFIGAANHKFNELQALINLVAEKSEDSSTAQTLARLASGIANNFCDLCSEELNDFKQHSPDLVKIFAEELAA